MCQSCNGGRIRTSAALREHRSTGAEILSPAPAPVLPVLPHQGGQFPLPFPAPDAGIFAEVYRLPEIEKRDCNGTPLPIELVDCVCGHSVPADETEEHSNGTDRVCSDCVCSCEDCGAVHASDDDDIRSAYDAERSGTRGDSYRCDNCCWKCADCSDYFYGSGHENAHGEKICQSCAENYYSCESCSQILHSDDAHGTDDGVYCRSCFEERERDNEEEEEEDSESSRSAPAPASSPIRAYDYKPRPIFFSLAEEKQSPAPLTYLGFEIETEKSGSTSHADAIRSCGLSERKEFYCKRDGSLTNGFEIVSHPGTLSYWLASDWTFAETLADDYEYDSEVKTAGMHIHISRSALSTAQVARLQMFVRDNAAFFKYVSRRVSSDDYYYKLDLRPTGAFIRKAQSGNSHAERYTAINLENDATIEFRLFQGTLDVLCIKRNLAIVAAIVDFIRSAPLSRLTAGDFRSYLSTAGARRAIGRTMQRELIAWIDDAPSSINGRAA
jgi:hypothetical protein